MIRVNPPHGHFRPDHLDHVIGEMRRRGAPMLRASYDREADIWHAREGTHRLRAAKALDVAPVLLPVPWPHTAAALVRARFQWDRHGHVFERVEIADPPHDYRPMTDDERLKMMAWGPYPGAPAVHDAHGAEWGDGVLRRCPQ